MNTDDNKIQFPEILGDKKLMDEIISGKREVLIYGFGAALPEILSALTARGVKILSGLDGNAKIWNRYIADIYVEDPQKYAGTDIPVIIASKTYYYEITVQLKKLGFQNVLPYFFIYSGQAYEYKVFNKIAEEANKVYLFNKALSDYKQIGKRNIVIINNMDIPITEKCSLKCKECSNLMQYFTKPQNADFAKVKASIDKIMRAVDLVNEFHILGGEPFIAKELPRYIEYLCAFSNVVSVVIYTNSTIIPKAETLRTLKNSKVIVRMSNYGKLSAKLEELTKIFEDNQIFYTVYDFSDWKKCATFDFQNRTEEELTNVFRSCCVANYLTLKDNLLYGCPFAGNAAVLRAVPAEVDECIDILAHDEAERLRTEIHEFTHKKYLKVCQYCKGRPNNITDIPAAVQTNKPLEYIKYPAFPCSARLK